MEQASSESEEKQSLVEFVVLPHMNYSSFLPRFTSSSRDLVILDTQGNILEDLGIANNLENIKLDFSWHMNGEKRLKNINYSFIFSINDLFEKLEKLKYYTDFTLVLDSVTFVGDKAPNTIRYLIKMLWSVIYQCRATIIAINHYRVGKEKRTYKLVPRMGTVWADSISSRIRFLYKNGHIEFKAEEKSVIDP